MPGAKSTCRIGSEGDRPLEDRCPGFEERAGKVQSRDDCAIRIIRKTRPDIYEVSGLPERTLLLLVADIMMQSVT